MNLGSKNKLYLKILHVFRNCFKFIVKNYYRPFWGNLEDVFGGFLKINLNTF